MSGSDFFPGGSLYPGYTGNATSQRQHVTLLPAVNQTIALTRFFGSTVDPVFQIGGYQPINGYIGQYPSYYNPVQDFYLPEPDTARVSYQLEPAMISIDTTGTLSHALTYPDLLGYLDGQGAVMGQDKRMFETDYYVWSPPVDIDKLTNFHQYYWFGDYSGATALPVLSLVAPTRAYVGDGVTQVFTLPDSVANIVSTQETIAAYVNSVRISNTTVSGTAIQLPLAPLPGDQVVVTRHDDLTVALTDASSGNAITQFALSGFVDPTLANAVMLTSGMRIDLQDTLRIFNGWSTENATGDGGTGYDQFWDECYLSSQSSPYDQIPVHDRAVWDGVPYGRFIVDGVGQGIRLTPDARMTRALDPQYVTIDRSSLDQNPWSLRNNWHHKDSFAWSGQSFANRQARRPIVEFVRDIVLNNYGTTHLEPVNGVLSSATALANGMPIPLAAIVGQAMGSVSVDNGVVLFNGMRLLVAQKALAGQPDYPNQQIYTLGQSTEGITLSQEPAAQPGDIVRVLGASGYGPAGSEMWFNGSLWTPAQAWQESAGEATDPRFRLFDLNGTALDDPTRYPNSNFTGSRLFGYALGSSTPDPVLRRALQYDNQGTIVFENDVVTRRAATLRNGIATPISGLYCYQTTAKPGVPIAFWHRGAQPTTQDIFVRDAAGVPSYTVPANLAANPGSDDVSLISRSDWVTHFRNEIANQAGFEGNPFATNNWRDTARDLSLGSEVLQHVAPMLKLMLLAAEPQYDYFAAVRFADAEYNLFRNKFVRKLVEFDRKGRLAISIADDGLSQTMSPPQIADNLALVLNTLKVDRSASFPFALSTMAATTASSQYFIPPTPAFLGLLPACQPGLITDDSYTPPLTFIRGHDGSLTPAYNDWRDTLLLALEQQIYAAIPSQISALERPAFDLAYYCAGRFCPSTSGAFATTDPHYIGVSYRRGEVQAMLAPLFERWAQTTRLDYRSNHQFDPANPFTWNYRGVTDRYGAALPGHFKAIYRWYFDTERPHAAPWEMLGFADEPSWWISQYGPAPYTSANTGLWGDLEAGLIRSGARAGVNLRYARPGLAGVIPVDAQGHLLDPVGCHIVAVPPDTTRAQRAWVNGDGGPVEHIWITSPSYRYALAQIAFLMKPARLVEMVWDSVHYGLSDYGDQWIDHRTLQRPLNAATPVHGEIGSDGVTPTVVYGIQQWLVDYLTASNKPASLLGDAVRGLDVRLLYRMAGFVTSDDLHVVADNFGVLPREDTEVILYTAPSTATDVYSGVLIEFVGTGWRVVGYDASTPHFTIIPPDTAGPSHVVSLADPPEPVIVEWHPNTYYRQGVIAAYQGYTYSALISHLSGPSFEQQYWNFDPTPYPTAPRVMHYLRGLPHTEATVSYGTELQTPQQVADFLWSYERWLVSRGWRFMAVDSNGVQQSWTGAVREFLTWTQVRWSIGNFIALSPGAATLHYEAATGTVLNVESNDTGYFGLLDRSGAPIPQQNVRLSRLGGDLVLNAINADIFAARVRRVVIEHALVFNNITIFNDVVYLPLFNMRQARLKLLANRTTDWVGRLDAPGFMVTGATLLPSFDRNVEDIRLMFDIEQSLRKDFTDYARHNINYQPRDYLENLLLSDVEQFEFYQGMIQQKGAPGVFEKLLRSARVSANSNIVFQEEFAIRQPARFGGLADPRIGCMLAQSSVVRDPQFIRLGNAVASDPTWIVLPPGDPRWVDPPPPTPGGFFAIQPAGRGPAYSHLLSAGPVRVNEVDYALFHIADLAAIYASAVASGGTAFLAGQTAWVYDRPDTRSWDVLRVFDLGIAPNLIPNLISATVTIGEDPTVNTVQIILTEPHGLTTADIGRLIVIAGPAYCVPEIAGIQTISAVNVETNSLDIDVAGLTGYNFPLNAAANPDRVAPAVRGFYSARFANTAAFNASPLPWPTGALTYVDADTSQNGLWSVQQNTDAGFSLARVQPPRVDPRQIARCSVYDSATRIADRQIIVNQPILNELVIIDPLAGFLPGVAMREITIQSEFDPAKYNTAALAGSTLYGRAITTTGDRIWGEAQVGLVWWDTATVRYLDPYTDQISPYTDQTDASTARDLAEINYRATYWAQIAPGTSVDVYEWVSSDVPPDDYATLGAADSTSRYRGTVYQRNGVTPYTEQSIYSAAFGRDIIRYYFWVSGLTTVPNLPARTISVSDVATILQNPTAQDIPWFAPILPDGMLVSGLAPHLNETSTVLKVQTRNRPVQAGLGDPGHDEWVLLRPNDARSQPPDWLWRDLVNSLAGFDETLAPMPDPLLHANRSVGIQPGQSLFAQDRDTAGDRLGLRDARASFIGIINTILAATPVIQQRPAGIAGLSRETPIGPDLIWTRPDNSDVIEPPPAGGSWPAGEWDYVTRSIGERNRLLLRPEFFAAQADGPIQRVLVNGTALSRPQWSVWWFDPAIAAHLLAVNATAQHPLEARQLLLNNADTVFRLAPAYDVAVANHAARNELRDIASHTRVYVEQDETVDGFWVIYRYDPTDPNADAYGFVVHRVQSYRTSDFYRIVDWYEQGFSDGTQTITFNANNPPQVSYHNIAQRDAVEGATPANVFVQILDPAIGDWYWQYYVDYVDDITKAAIKGWFTVAQHASTIAFSANFYNSILMTQGDGTTHGIGKPQTATVFNRDGAWEIKLLADALRAGGLLLNIEINQVLFSMIHFIHAQQDEVDWVFKSSFMVIAGYLTPLQQSGIQQADVTDSLIAYINEVKPYHVKIRDYTKQYVPDQETANSRISDFDRTVYYDGFETLQANPNVPVQRLNPLANADLATMTTLYGAPVANLAVLNWQNWQDQHATGPGLVRHITTTLRFNRLTDRATDATRDGLIANTTNVVWDDIGWHLDETGADTAAQQIMDNYTPRSGMPPLTTPADLINTLYRFPTVPLEGGALANAALANTAATLVVQGLSGNTASNAISVTINPDTAPSNAVVGNYDPAYGHFDPDTRAPSTRFVDPVHPEERVAMLADDSVIITVTAYGTPGAPAQQVHVFDLYDVTAPVTLRFGAPAQSVDGVWVYLDGVRAQNGTDYTVDLFGQTITLLRTAQRVSIRSFGFGGTGGIIEQHAINYDPSAPLALTTQPNAACVQVLVEGVLQANSGFAVANGSLSMTGAIPTRANVAVVVWDNTVDTTCRVQTQILDLSNGVLSADGYRQYGLTMPDDETRPLHAGTVVELDGRRLTPPLTYYGRIAALPRDPVTSALRTPIDAHKRVLTVDFDVSANTVIDLLINGTWMQNVAVPRWNTVASDDSVTGYPFNLIANTAQQPVMPGGFVLYGRSLVATDNSFASDDFGAVFYETVNPLGATMDYQVANTDAGMVVRIADALVANASQGVVTTFSHAGLLAIRTQTSFAAIDSTYRFAQPFSPHDSMVSFDRMMLAPEVDYDVAEVKQAFGQAAFGRPFDEQYTATVLTIPRDPAVSANVDHMQPVVATVFNGALARLPVMLRQATTTPANLRMIHAATTGGWDEDRFDAPFRLFDAYNVPPAGIANTIGNDPTLPISPRVRQYGERGNATTEPIPLYDMPHTWEFRRQNPLAIGTLAAALQPDDVAITINLDALAGVSPHLWPIGLVSLDNGTSYHWSGSLFTVPDRRSNRPGVVWVGAERIEYLSLDYVPDSVSDLPVVPTPPVIVLRDLRRGTRGTQSSAEHRLSVAFTADGNSTHFVIDAPVIPEVQVRMGNATVANWANYAATVTSTLTGSGNGSGTIASTLDHFWPTTDRDHQPGAVRLAVAPPAGAWVSLGATLDQTHPVGTRVLGAA